MAGSCCYNADERCFYVTWLCIGVISLSYLDAIRALLAKIVSFASILGENSVYSMLMSKLQFRELKGQDCSLIYREIT